MFSEDLNDQSKVLHFDDTFEKLKYTVWQETECSMGLSTWTGFTQDSLTSKRVFQGTFLKVHYIILLNINISHL